LSAIVRRGLELRPLSISSSLALGSALVVFKYRLSEALDILELRLENTLDVMDDGGVGSKRGDETKEFEGGNGFFPRLAILSTRFPV
jgi:hypothetical protein